MDPTHPDYYSSFDLDWEIYQLELEIESIVENITKIENDIFNNNSADNSIRDRHLPNSYDNISKEGI